MTVGYIKLFGEGDICDFDRTQNYSTKVIYECNSNFEGEAEPVVEKIGTC